MVRGFQARDPQDLDNIDTMFYADDDGPPIGDDNEHLKGKFHDTCD